MKAGRILAWTLLAALTLAGLSACVRTDSFIHFRELERELMAARELKADRYAASAYDYWYAVECLQKSKESHSYSDFGPSEALAQEGLKAVARAKVAATAGGKQVEEPKPEDIERVRKDVERELAAKAKRAEEEAP